MIKLLSFLPFNNLIFDNSSAIKILFEISKLYDFQYQYYNLYYS